MLYMRLKLLMAQDSKRPKWGEPTGNQSELLPNHKVAVSYCTFQQKRMSMSCEVIKIFTFVAVSYKVAFSNRRNTKMRIPQQPRKIWTYGFVLLKVLFQSIFKSCNDFWENHHLQFLDFSSKFLRSFSACFYEISHFSLSSITQRISTNEDECVMMTWKLFFQKRWSAAFKRISHVFWQILAEHWQFKLP